MIDVLNLTATLASLPAPWPDDLLPAIQAANQIRPHKVWILDDDPTGTQTIAAIPVLTHWSVAALAAEFDDPSIACFILTNSRGLTAELARNQHRQIARHLQRAAVGRPFSIISRSDSTLRGHFPLETDTLHEVIGEADLTLIAPYFEAGGRLTIHDVHYVIEDDTLVPAAATPFASDAVFGYTQSNLKLWVQEKTAGRIPADQVISLSLDLIRKEGPSGVARVLQAASPGSVVIANAAASSDIEVVTVGVLSAEAAGRHILARSAAAFVSARLGQRPPPLLSGSDMVGDTQHGGLIVAGSYVPKTTAQLAHLTTHHDLTHIELDVSTLLDEVTRIPVVQAAADQINAAIAAGGNVLLSTSRKLVRSSDTVTNLNIGSEVSHALIDVVTRLTTRPRFLIAKGGITSSDVATQALGIKRAVVRGQILPGVPVWACGPETRFPCLSFIVFPGNVGAATALSDAVTKLTLP